MSRAVRLASILVLSALALALARAPVSPAREAATCTPAQKRGAQAALAAYRKAMPKRRTAYFRTHRRVAQRRAFVRKQQKRLAALRRAAACTVVSRPTPPPAPPPAPPPPPPPPAADTTPPRFSAADVNEATLTLSFDEALAGAQLPASAFSVTVDGLRWRVESATIDGPRVVLRLGIGVMAAEAAEVAYGPAAAALRDASGNPVASFTAAVANSTPAGPPPPAEPGFSPSIPKPSFADDRTVREPWVGQWGPKTDPYWLRSTGTLRGLILPVDFADAPATRTVDFYRDYLEPASESYFRENSYGRLAVELDTFGRWVRMSSPAAAYATNCCPFDRRKDFFAEATGLADPEVDFSTYDAVFVVAPESLAGTIPLSLFRPWPGDGVIRDGRELRWGVIGGGGIDPRGPSPNLAAHHIVTHETGHFWGLADLYEQAQRGTPDQFAWAGRWDLMSDNRASSHMFAWNKWLLGWLDPTQLRGLTAPGSTEAELTPLPRKGGLKAVVVPVSPTIVYVIENRQRIGEDVELCDKGVLVWVVDGSRRNVERNAVVQAAQRSYNDDCGAIFDAGYDAGQGEVSTFEDANVRMDVLAALPNGNYRVRVTRK